MVLVEDPPPKPVNPDPRHLHGGALRSEASSPHFLRSQLSDALDAAPSPHLAQTRTTPALLPHPWAYAPRPLAGCFGRNCAPCRSGAPTLTSARRSFRASSASALPTGAPERACIISSPCPLAPTAIPTQGTSVERMHGCRRKIPTRHTGSRVKASSSTTTQSALTLPRPSPNA